MNSKGHLFISIIKSSLRISGCIMAFITYNLYILAVCFGIAELLGIAEELVDKR